MMRTIGAAAAGLLLLSACASTGAGPGTRLDQDRVQVIAQETPPDGLDPFATAAYWGTRHDRDPADPAAAVAFSKSLRAVQNNEEALRVISRAVTRTEGASRVKLELGKALIANDRAHEAVRPIEDAIAGGLMDDWTAFSAYGVALDKTGRHAQARVQYDRALSLAPGKASVLNNKGLSYALEGKTALAERTLRAAAVAEGGNSRVRQNLAMILGLGGRMSEAEALARADLPPRVADGNVAYFRSLVAQPAYWAGLSTTNAELPRFDDDAVPEGPMMPTFDPARGPRPDEAAPTPSGKPVPSGKPGAGEDAPAPFEPEAEEEDPAEGLRAEADAANAAPLELSAAVR